MTVASARAARHTLESGRSTSPLLARTLGGWLVALPDRFVQLGICGLLAVAIPLQLGLFHPYVVGPLFVVLAAASWRMVPHRVALDRGQLIGSGVALIVALVWVLLNRHQYSELLGIQRDPSIYTLRGLWLMNHSSPNVTLTHQLLAIQRAVPGVGLDFGSGAGALVLYPQSTTIVPGLMAVAGWIGGPNLLFQANVFVGGGALIAVYAVGRRFSGPIFGLVPILALATSMPLAYFSRSAFTEPVALFGTMVCMLGLQTGLVQKRRALWAVAGVGAGIVMIARIDGAIVGLGALLGIGIWGGLARSRGRRHEAGLALLFFCIGLVVVGGIGISDLAQNSPIYFKTLLPLAGPLFAAMAAVAVIAGLVIYLPGFPALARWVTGHARMLSFVVGSLVAVVIAAMFLRPLYWEAHRLTGAYAAAIAAHQHLEHLPNDPTRSYDEQSLRWMAWYFGWPTVAIAGIAGVVAVVMVFRRRLTPVLLVAAPIVVSSVLYLNYVTITPDQIWAMRRFLPVIIPGGLLMVSWMLSVLWNHRSALLPRLKISPRVRRGSVAAVVVAAMAFVSVYPVTTWRSLFSSREGAGLYQFTANVCSEVGTQHVLLIGGNDATGAFLPAIRDLCGGQVISLQKPSTTDISRIVGMWGTAPIKVVSFHVDTVPWTRKPNLPDFTATTSVWESVLSHRPAKMTVRKSMVWIGTARSDGMVVPT